MFNVHQLSADTEATQVVPPQNITANIAATASVSMVGWDGVEFNIDVGVVGNNAAVSAYAIQSANANLSGATNINYPNGTLASINIPNANANVHAVLDVFRPASTYVGLVINGGAGVANGAQICVSAVQYRRTGILPPTHAAYQTVFAQVS